MECNESYKVLSREEPIRAQAHGVYDHIEEERKEEERERIIAAIREGYEWGRYAYLPKSVYFKK